MRLHVRELSLRAPGSSWRFLCVGDDEPSPHVRQLEEGGPPHFVSRLAAQCRMLDVAGASGFRIDKSVEATNERFADGRREAHMGVEANYEYSVCANRTKPIVQARVGECTVHILLEQSF